MMRKNTSRDGGKQTSTPLSESKGDASLKSFGNVSTIRNEHKGARHSVTGSPIILDWKGVPKSPAISSKYKKITIPAKKLSKRRCDTPLKMQEKSAFCPLKLKFSKNRLSNVNPKLPVDKRRRSARIIKHLLDSDEKLVSTIENKEFINKEITDSEFCRDKNNVGGRNTEGLSKEISCKINVSFSRLSKNESLLQKEYADKSESFEYTCDDSYETFEYTTYVTESELLNTSDMIESCRRESISVIASDTMDLSGLDMLSDAYITSSRSEQSSENTEYLDDDVISTGKHYLEEKSNESSSKNKLDFGEFLPESSISVDCDLRENDKDKSIFKRSKTPGDISSNKVRIGELEIKDGIAEEKISTAQAIKENVADCNLHLGEFVHIKDGKSCKKRNKYRKPLVTCKKKQVIQAHSLKNNVNKSSILLHTSNKSVTKSTSNESFHQIQRNRTMKDIERNDQLCKNHEDNEMKDVTDSNHLKNRKECSDERLFNLLNNSHKHTIKITDDQYDAEINGNTAENKSLTKDLSKILVEDIIPNSDNIQSHSGQKKGSEVEIFKKPFAVKKNATSKQHMRAKEKKAKMASLYPSTSTPICNSSDGEGKLLSFNTVSPIRIAGVENKSYSSDDFLNITIKDKKSCAKSAKVHSEFDKEISKWKSFRKKPSDQKKTCYCANDSSISKSSDNLYQFENSQNVNEGVPIDDILILWNKFRRSRMFKKRDKQDETKDTSKKEKTKTKKK